MATSTIATITTLFLLCFPLLLPDWEALLWQIVTLFMKQLFVRWNVSANEKRGTIITPTVNKQNNKKNKTHTRTRNKTKTKLQCERKRLRQRLSRELEREPHMREIIQWLVGALLACETFSISKLEFAAFGSFCHFLSGVRVWKNQWRIKRILFWILKESLKNPLLYLASVASTTSVNESLSVLFYFYLFFVSKNKNSRRKRKNRKCNRVDDELLLKVQKNKQRKTCRRSTKVIYIF